MEENFENGSNVNMSEEEIEHLFENQEALDLDSILDKCDSDIFEELHYSENGKYCVPIYAGESGSIFRGSGVIVGNYLITAAHVAQTEPDKFRRKDNYSTLYFRFEGKIQKIGDGQCVHDGRGYHLHCENYDDLIVYQLDGIKSPFVLYNGRPKVSLKLAAFFYYKNTNIETVKDVCKVTSSEVICKERSIHWKNCFQISQNSGNSIIRPGNSGGPVFRNDVVYGILIIDNGVGTVGTVIDSQYIQKCIDEAESKNKNS